MTEGRKYSGHYDAVLDIIRDVIRNGRSMISWDYGSRNISYAKVVDFLREMRQLLTNAMPQLDEADAHIEQHPTTPLPRFSWVTDTLRPALKGIYRHNSTDTYTNDLRDVEKNIDHGISDALLEYDAGLLTHAEATGFLGKLRRLLENELPELDNTESQIVLQEAARKRG